MTKYKVPVFIQTVAEKEIGFVECDSLEEYHDKSQNLWESQDYASPMTNIHNDFELTDWNLSEVTQADLEFYGTQCDKKTVDGEKPND